jgi:hypothetical protein
MSFSSHIFNIKCPGSLQPVDIFPLLPDHAAGALRELIPELVLLFLASNCNILINPFILEISGSQKF